MIPPRFHGPIGAISLLAVGCVCLAVFDPDGKSRVSEYWGLGYLFGTLFGQATLAAAWTAFGPLPWYVRLPLAMVWVGMLWLALAGNIGIHGGPDEILVVLAACLLGQWLLVQAPLWGLALFYGLRFQHRPAGQFDFGGPQHLQFGIRELMVFTAVVALLLGVSRAVILLVAEHMDDASHREAPVFIFLAVAAVIMTLPLLMAALLPRWAVAASLVVLVLIGLATLAELPLLRVLPPRPGPDFWHFVFINAFTAAWILAPIGIMRLGGWGLAVSAPSDELASEGNRPSKCYP